MMMKRFISYVALAFCACFVSFSAQAVERFEYFVGAAYDAGCYGAKVTQHDLTLVQWRTGVGVGSEAVASNLIALSNHFGLDSAAPFGVPDWDSGLFV